MKENQMNQELLTHIIDYVTARDTGLSPLYSKRVRARAWDRAKEAKRRAFEAARKADRNCGSEHECPESPEVIRGRAAEYNSRIGYLEDQVDRLKLERNGAWEETRCQVEMKKEAEAKVEKLRSALRDCRDTFRHIIDNTPIGLSPFSTDTLALVEQVLGETA